MYFDDFEAGQVYHTGSRVLSKEDIIGFASQWDRQSFHLDEDAAKASIYGGLIASGFHTLVTTFDLIIDTGIWEKCSRGSPGFQELKWIKPVRPGDALTVEFSVVEKRPSKSRTDQGYLIWDHITRNQDGVTVMTFRSTTIATTKAGAGIEP
ncbi:MAG: MaoC family dehydratase [Pseudomonadota bacterium]